MIGLLAEVVQQAPPESWAESLGPLVALASLLWGGWQTIKAAKRAALLRAAIVGVRAGLDSLAHEDAERVKAQIEAAAGGKEAPLNRELKAEVRKTTSAIPVYREDGLPRLGALLLCACLLAAPGCVSAAVHDAAIAAQDSAKILHAASVPNPAYTDSERAAWERLWASHSAALAEIERASR